MDTGGTLRTNDSTGALIGELETGLPNAFDTITLDPATGKLAVASVSDGVGVIDPMTDLVQRVPGRDRVASLGFGSGGTLLSVATLDGLVRLWDVDRGDWAGTMWNGSGALESEPSWYDERTETFWIYTSGELIQVPLDPERWVATACQIVGRDLTQDEWDRHVPGATPRQTACT